MVDIISHIQAGLWGGLIAFVASIALVLSTGIHGHYSLDSDVGIQKLHTNATPRVGGLAIMGGFIMAGLFLHGEAQRLWGIIGLAGLPALAFGLAEDLTKKVSVKWRLLATIFSGLIFAVLSGYSITSVDLGWMDLLLGVPALAFAFTAFAVGGVANSINIIDGFHGLASGTLMIILMAFALVGHRVGDTLLVEVAVTMLLVVGGFFIVNFPRGKLFLGDAGAYFTGYVVAVMAVLLPARNLEVSPWVSLLVLAYPVTETLVSILRRLVKQGHSPGAPDSDHLHHVVHRGWALRLGAHMASPEAGNALTSAIVWPLPCLTLVAVQIGTLQTGQTMLLLLLGVAIYALYYRIALAAGRTLSDQSKQP